ncbi:MAG: type II secretion system secretin GspD [Pseudomonadales bacterium]
MIRRLHSTLASAAVHRRLLPALLLLASFSVASQQSADDERITMNMRDADVRTVIQWMAETTGKHFIIDPQVQGKISVVASETLSTDEAFQVFLKALEVSGFSAIEKGKSITVVPNAKSSKTNTAVLDSFSGRSSSERAVHVITLKNVTAADLAAQLRPLISDSSYLTALPASNTLIIADQVDNILRIKELVRRIDLQGSINIDVVKLKYASADDALQSLGKLMGNASGYDNGAPMLLNVASDARTNSILISGIPSKRAQIRDLLRRIDRPLEKTANTKVVYLNYLQAKELVPILEGMSGSLQKDDKEVTIAKATISIQASESSNALVMTAPPPLLKDMEDVIKRIDVRRSQVLIEALIVEVNDDVADDIGVQWNTELNGDGVEAATDFGLANIDRVTDSAGNVIEENLALGRGFTLGYFRNGDIRALLTAFESNTKANMLSTPSIITLDNQEAEILVGSSVPFITGETTGDFSETENPFRTIERKDIGVSLKITPQINNDQSITLDILQEVENLTDSTVAEDLITNKRSIKTRVLVDDRETLVLGGLTEKNNTEIISRVPVLGYIPILGKLFQRKGTEETRNNLMVFIHPVILNKVDKAKEVTRQRYDSIRDKQQKYNEPKNPFDLKRKERERPRLPELPQE